MEVSSFSTGFAALNEIFGQFGNGLKRICMHDDEQLLHFWKRIATLKTYIRTWNFEGQAAVGSYSMITNSNIRLSGS